MNTLRVVLVEDDEALREGLKEYLQLSGCQVTAVPSGLEFFAALTSQHEFQVAVIDLGLPDVDGRRLVEHLRQHTRIKIIVLTANHTADVRIDSYTAGADLYMGKPVDPRELAAALRSLGQRQEPPESPPAETADHAGWQLLCHDWTLHSPGGKVLNLTAREFQLISHLASAQGQLVKRSEICQRLYQRYDHSAEAALATQIKRIRQHLAEAGMTEDPIRTGHGTGYCFSAPILIR